MSLKALILADYKEAVALNVSIPSDLKRAMKTNERVPVFLERLAAELDLMEKRNMKLDRNRIKSIVYEMTDFFLFNVKRKLDMQAASDLANKALTKKAPDLAALLDDQGNGEIPELGLTIRDRVHAKKQKSTS